MATLTGKAISDLDEATAVQDSDLIAISRQANSLKMTLGTLVGNLLRKTGGTMIGPIFTKSSQIDPTTTPSSLQSGVIYGMMDANEETIGYIGPQLDTSGSLSLGINARRKIGANAIINNLLLKIASDGTKSVQVSDPAEWIAAMGFELPVSVAHGGTGQTAINTTTTISNIATAASGCEIIAAAYTQWGKVAMVSLTIRKAEATTTSGAMTLATMVSGKRPAFNAEAVTINNTMFNGYIQSSGNVVVNGTNTANQTIYVFSTFILA